MASGEGLARSVPRSGRRATRNPISPRCILPSNQHRAARRRWVPPTLSITTQEFGSNRAALVVRESPCTVCGMSVGKILLVVLGIVVALVLVVGLSISGIYNRLVSLQQGTDAAWAQVQNVYQRRADLVPNLVSTVSGAANFEKSTLNEIVQARASVGQVTMPTTTAPTDPQQFAKFEQAQAQLGSALSRLLVVSERYPELKATQSFRDLQAQLEGTENRIAVERGRFNEAVQAYDTAIRSFPAVIFAGMFGHQPRPYFNATPGADRPPEVKFDFSQKAPAVPAPAARP
jgi:LemA protein